MATMALIFGGWNMSNRRNTNGDGLFGYGYMGLPGEIDLALADEAACEQLAHEIITRWHEWAESRQLRTGRRAAERQFNEIATLASILIRHYVRRKLAPSPLAAHALEHALGLINPRSGQPVPSAAVVRRFGLPVIADMDSFLKAARLDGEADAAGEPLSQRRLAKALGKAESTVRAWRAMPQYIQRRVYAGNLAGSGVRPDRSSSHS
jgi:hypothetical protein